MPLEAGRENPAGLGKRQEGIKFAAVRSDNKPMKDGLKNR